MKTLYSGGAVCTSGSASRCGVQGTMARASPWCRAGGTATSSRGCGWCRPTAGRPSGSGRRARGPATVALRSAWRGVCAGPVMPAIGGQRLRVLHVDAGVDHRQVATEIGVGEGAHQRQDAAVLHFARPRELDGRCGPLASIVPVWWLRAPYSSCRFGAVGIGGVQVHAAARGAIPAREQHAAVCQHRGRQVVALVEGDLVDVACRRRSSRAARRRFRCGCRSAPRSRACLRRAGWPSTGAGAWRRTGCGRRAGTAGRRHGLRWRWCRRLITRCRSSVGDVVFPDLPRSADLPRPGCRRAGRAWRRRSSCHPARHRHP